MGCNCGGKKKPAPAPAPVQSTKEDAPVASGGTTQSFVLDLGSNRTQTFGSRLEADAARVRSGGQGRVRPL